LGAIEKVLESFEEFPSNVYISLNASPATILSGEFTTLLRKAPRDRLVLEITEHAAVEDYAALGEALAPLRRTGVRVAIDDAGAGYASLQHIVRLSPDIIKLDMSLTRGIDTNLARRALASALVFFARETDCIIIAEGIETAAELEVLKLLGVSRGQGYFLGRPLDGHSARKLLSEPIQRMSA
jgi:EAL domain-containing protein (putative c-di-GMP-specific phosphodiesterase class I)